MLKINAVMAAICKAFIEIKSPASVVLTAGDQQSYNRMVWKKKDAPKANDVMFVFCIISTLLGRLLGRLPGRLLLPLALLLDGALHALR